MTQGDLAEFLRLTRVAAGLTRAQLAERAGVSDESVRCWEDGHRLESVARFMTTLEAAGVRIVVSKRKPKTTVPWMRLLVP